MHKMKLPPSLLLLAISGVVSPEVMAAQQVVEMGGKRQDHDFMVHDLMVHSNPDALYVGTRRAGVMI